MMRTRYPWGAICGCIALSCFGTHYLSAAEPWEREAAEEFARRFAFQAPIDVPEVDGAWWQITRNPDLGALTGILTKEDAEEQGGRRQEPVDFAIWQAADGTWQLVSCIRNTKEVGYTRLFFRWEGQGLTDTEWEAKGVFHRADPRFGESPGYLQAPHTIVINGVYHMFYNSGSKIFCMTSDDGKRFVRRRNENGSLVVVGGCGRDLNISHINGLWHLYYVGSDGDMCRTSADLENWSDPIRVTCGPFESPFLVRREDCFYLFVSSRGQGPLGRVYRPSDPLDFGTEDERHLITSVFEPPHVASEIVQHGDRYYIAVYSLKQEDLGIRMARLKWVKKSPQQIVAWRIENLPRFRPRTTAELAEGKEWRGAWHAHKKRLDELREAKQQMGQDAYDKAVSEAQEVFRLKSKSIRHKWKQIKTIERNNDEK